MSNENIALSLLMAQHDEEQKEIDRNNPTVTVKLSLVPDPIQQPGAKRDDGSVKAPPNARTVFGLIMPPKGSLEAKGFMFAMRHAGERRNDKGALYVDPLKVRDDQIQAISGYVGYDTRQDFGVQEVAARAQAQREIRGAVGGKTRAEQKQINRSLSGFVNGMPDNISRKVDDLLARETVSAEAMLQHEKVASDLKCSQKEREEATALALVERERLSAIRADLKALVGG